MKFKLSVAQMKVTAGSPEANLKRAESLIAEASKSGASLICLPEMWTTGFDWQYIDANYTMQADTVREVSNFAVRYDLWINGSMLYFNEYNRPTNSSILFDPTGNIRAVYHKIHLFRPMGEDKHLTAGDRPVLIDTPLGKIALTICYDLRFPEHFIYYALKGAEVILLTAAFPHPRINHWKTLLRARAIENQLYVVATNRVGYEAGLQFFGCSMVVDPWGDTVAEAPVDEEFLMTIEIDLDKLDEIRRLFPVLKDRRPEVYGWF